MPAKSKAAAPKDSSANLGFEAKLWLTADKLRNNMDAAEYKHVVLGLICLPHHSVALQEVQDKRDKIQIPGGLLLHEYANVYFHARNPMMSRRRNEAHALCVLRVSTEILKIPGAVITDQNAVSKYVKFLPCLYSLCFWSLF